MNRIKELRKQSGMTQTELGRKLGVTKSTMSMWENDVHKPGIEILKKMADVFGVTVDTLICGNDVTIPPEYPKTEEAKILVRGIDRLPREQREQALNVVRAMFSQFSEYFEERE